VAFLAVVLSCASAPVAISPNDLDDVEHAIRSMVADRIGDDAPALAFALVHGDEIVFEGADGFADRELERAADQHTVFRVGSISKLMTAIAMMQLVERGKVELDAPLRRYLPEFTLGPPLRQPGGWSIDDITLRGLLAHHSGMPSDHFHRFFSSDPHDYDEFVELALHEHAAAPAGQIFAYSNFGFTLLGIVVERVSGVPFVDYVQRNVLEPSGMASSSFLLNDDLNTRLANGYRDGKRGRYVRIGPVPAGSLYSSAHDLALFARMILKGGVGPGGRILREETLREMWQPQYDDAPLDLGFPIGLSWFLESIRGVGSTVGHDGGTAYFSSRLIISPEHDLAAVAIVNSADAGDAYSRQIANRTLQLATAALTGRAFTPEPTLAPFAATISADRVKAIEGHYQTLVGHVLFEAKGTSLYGSMFGQTVELRPTQRGNFGGRLWILGVLPLRLGPFGQFEFAFVDVGDTVAFVLERDGSRFLGGTRIDPSRPAGLWLERIGEYEPLDPTDDILIDEIGLAEHEGALAVRLHGPSQPAPGYAAIRPLDDETAVVLGQGRDTGGVVRFVDGVLSYSGFRSRLVPGGD
jgi:CubicO group peptidase (beta-lactamase class C family)